MTSLQAIQGILVAALCGGAVGLERQRSGHAGVTAGHEDAERFAGIRTFTLLGVLAGVAGWLWTSGFEAVGTVLLGGACVLVSAAYFAASRRSVDGTTEVAALVVLAAGFLAGVGRHALASGLSAATVLLLLEKSRLHAWVARLDDAELRAGIRFAVMAAVILPLLPAGPFGPGPGIRPRELWVIVLVIGGLEFAGYLAYRRVGRRHGYTVAGLLGGLVSSTSVTLTYARMARQEPALALPLTGGAIAANTALFPRVVLTALVLNPALGVATLPYLAAPFLVVLGALLLSLHTAAGSAVPDHVPRNPLRVWPAVQLALVYQAALYAIHFAGRALGDSGLYVSGFVLGITDIDALTISLARQGPGTSDIPTFALVIALGVVGTTLFKFAIAVALGSGAFRRRVGIAFMGMLVALVAGVAIGL